MWPDRVSNPGPLTYESGALPTALRGPASWMRKDTLKYKLSEMNFDFEISRINCRRQKYSFSVYSVDYPPTNTRRQLIRKDMTQHGLIAIHSKGR